MRWLDSSLFSTAPLEDWNDEAIPSEEPDDIRSPGPLRGH